MRFECMTVSFTFYIVYTYKVDLYNYKFLFNRNVYASPIDMHYKIAPSTSTF